MSNEIIYDDDVGTSSGGDIMRGARVVRKDRGYPVDYVAGQSNASQNSDDITNSPMFRELFGSKAVEQFKSLERKANANKITVIDMGIKNNSDKGGNNESENNTSDSH